MTREEAKKMMPIIQAFAEGKTIEIYVEGKNLAILPQNNKTKVK